MEKDIKFWHEMFAKEYHDEIYNNKMHWVVGREVIKSSGTREGEFILDVGCGSGRCSIPAKFEVGADVVGVDLSLKLLKKLRVLSMKNIPVVLGDGENLPFRDNIFDKVISNEVWIHIPTALGREKFVCEINRVLKRGGRIFLSRIRRSKFYSKDLWLGKDRCYIHYFSVKEIIHYFRKAGLIRLSIKDAESQYHRWLKSEFLKSLLSWIGFWCVNIMATKP